MKENTKYYLIYKRIVGKKDEDGYKLFQDGKWVVDDQWIIMDHLNGYDPYEPQDSPYAMYNSSIMAEIEEITEEQAIRICLTQTPILLENEVS